MFRFAQTATALRAPNFRLGFLEAATPMVVVNTAKVLLILEKVVEANCP